MLSGLSPYRALQISREAFSSRKAFSDCSSHSCLCVSDSFILSRNPGQIFPTEEKAIRGGEKKNIPPSALLLLFFAVETVWRKKRRENILESFFCVFYNNAQLRAKQSQSPVK
jgi:hypothetical protein